MKLKTIIIALSITSILFGLEYHSDGKPIYEPMEITVYPIENMSVDEMDDITIYPINIATPIPDKNETNPTIFNASIYLNKGWNLIGIDSEIDLNTLKKNIGTSNLEVIKGDDTSLTTFSKLDAKKGYWIKVSQSVHLKYFKLKNITRDIKLSAGWNLINPLGELSLLEIKSQIGESNLEVIQGFRKRYKKSYKDNSQDFLNDFDRFEEDKGYWVKVKREVTLKF